MIVHLNRIDCLVVAVYRISLNTRFVSQMEGTNGPIVITTSSVLLWLSVIQCLCYAGGKGCGHLSVTVEGNVDQSYCKKHVIDWFIV